MALGAVCSLATGSLGGVGDDPLIPSPPPARSSAPRRPHLLCPSMSVQPTIALPRGPAALSQNISLSALRKTERMSRGMAAAKMTLTAGKSLLFQNLALFIVDELFLSVRLYLRERYVCVCAWVCVSCADSTRRCAKTPYAWGSEKCRCRVQGRWEWAVSFRKFFWEKYHMIGCSDHLDF